jgi:hypothetical protein
LIGASATKRTGSSGVEQKRQDSQAIGLFDRDLFIAVPRFCRRCPDIAFYGPHHARPLCTRECIDLNRDRRHSDQLATI